MAKGAASSAWAHTHCLYSGLQFLRASLPAPALRPALPATHRQATAACLLPQKQGGEISLIDSCPGSEGQGTPEWKRQAPDGHPKGWEMPVHRQATCPAPKTMVKCCLSPRAGRSASSWSASTWSCRTRRCRPQGRRWARCGRPGQHSHMHARTHTNACGGTYTR